jgi:hypothetical protein
MLIVARSSGRPTRLLRSAPVTNSSISLPRWRVMPRTIEPAAASGESVLPAPSSLKASGFRNPSMSPMSASVPSAFVRATSSVSIEWPKR